MTLSHESTWDKRGLEALIRAGAEESLHLEFKKADALGSDNNNKTDISKDVSAFANADGGVLIYGISGHGKPTRAEGFDPVDTRQFSAEWLEQVINSRVEPPVHGTTIQAVPLDGAKTIYVVDIPRSTRPHQAADGRYYRRHNFQVLWMHDYEIEELRNRGTAPRLEVLTTPSNRTSMMSRDKSECFLSVKIHNMGNNVAREVYLELRGPREFMSAPAQFTPTSARDEILNDRIFRVFPYYHDTPIYPRTYIEVFDGNARYQKVVGTKDQVGWEDCLTWKVFALSMNPNEGSITIAKLLGFTDN